MPSTHISRGAENYDRYMGRWSRRLAQVFLDFAGLAANERVLDVGCGTGSLTFLIPDCADVAHVEAIDYDADFIAAARDRNAAPKISFSQGDASCLRFSNGTFDRVLSMLVLHFV